MSSNYVTLFVTAWSALMMTAAAAEYPERPIRMVVPLPAAGTTDIVARVVAQKLNEAWGQPVIVDNRSGAGTTLGSGQVHAIFSPIAEILPHVRAGGKVRTLAVTSPQRVAELPDTPTLGEAGLPGSDVVTCSGIYAPTGTPRVIVNRLNAEINRMVQQPEVRERFLGIGLVPVGGTPAALGDYLKSEIARWTKVVKAAGIKLE